MSQTRILIVAILTVLMTFIYASNAQDRPEGGPQAMGPQPERPMGPESPVPWMREYAEELRLRAREAQEFAERLRQDADRFEQMARQGKGPEMGPGPMEPMRRELAEIKEAIGRAEREGRPDEAAELRKKAERLMDQMRAREQQPQGDERRFGEMKERIEQLKNQMREAEERGRPDEARELRGQIQNIEMKMRREMESRDMGPQIESMRDKVAELRRQSQRAKQEGRFDEAQAQWEKANDIELQIKKAQQKDGGVKMGPEMKRFPMQEPNAEKGPQMLGGDLPREMERLRAEVARLQQEVGQLKRQLSERESR
jgi:hypothetical protein